MQIIVEFGGGLDLLFANRKQIRLEAPADSTMQWLMEHLRDRELSDRPELFMSGNRM